MSLSGHQSARSKSTTYLTPPEILSLMTRAAFALTKRGYVLRSGHAIGADSARSSSRNEIGRSPAFWLRGGAMVAMTPP